MPSKKMGRELEFKIFFWLNPQNVMSKTGKNLKSIIIAHLYLPRRMLTNAITFRNGKCKCS